MSVALSDAQVEIQISLSTISCNEEMLDVCGEDNEVVPISKNIINTKVKLCHRRPVLFKFCHLSLIQQASTVYEKEKDIISVVSARSSIAPALVFHIARVWLSSSAVSPSDGGVWRHLDHQPRGYSDPHCSAGERRLGAGVARRQAGEALYSVALWLTYQFGHNLDYGLFFLWEHETLR